MTKKSRERGQHFIIFHDWVLKSHAWRALSLKSRCVLLDLWMRHNGTNNGLIHYSCEEAAAAINGVKDTGASALKELIELGFLIVTRDAAFRSKAARTFRLTMEKSWNGRPATKEFMSWRPADSPAKINFPVRPVGLHSPPRRTRKTTASKTPRNINDLNGGAASVENGTSETP